MLGGDRVPRLHCARVTVRNADRLSEGTRATESVDDRAESLHTDIATLCGDDSQRGV